MELQFQSGICRCLKAATRDVRNAEVTQEVRLSDGMPDIGRVLTSWGQIILRSKEWQGDLVAVSGGIMVWILYAPEDGTPPRCLDAWVPFQLKWEVEDKGSEGPVRVYPLLRFVDSRSISGRKMMIRAGVAAVGEALVPMQAQLFYPAELPDDIQLLRNTYPVRLNVEAGEKTFLLDEDLQISAGSVQPERLLAYTITPQIQEKRVAGDKLIMRGTGKLRIIYRCAEGKVHAAELEVPIAQYAQLEDTYGNDALADVLMGVTSLELFQTEDLQLRLKCGLVAQYLISDRCLIDVTEDAYSPHREIGLQAEELKLPSILDRRVELIQAHQQLPGVSGDVVDVNFLPDFPRQSRSGDQLTLDLPGQFQLLYYAPDGVLQGANGRSENSVTIAADSGSIIDCLIQQPDVVRTAQGAEEMHMNCQYKLELCTRSQAGIPMIRALEAAQLDTPDAERPSLILCRSNGEKLWDMAKRYGSTVEDIRRVNHLEEECHENRMLLIPVS